MFPTYVEYNVRLPKSVYYLSKLFKKLDNNVFVTNRGWEYLVLNSHTISLQLIEQNEPYKEFDPHYIKIYPKKQDREKYQNYVEITFEDHKYIPFYGTIIANVKDIDTNIIVGEPYIIGCWLWNDIHFEIIELTDFILEVSYSNFTK